MDGEADAVPADQESPPNVSVTAVLLTHEALSSPEYA